MDMLVNAEPQGMAANVAEALGRNDSPMAAPAVALPWRLVAQSSQESSLPVSSTLVTFCGDEQGVLEYSRMAVWACKSIKPVAISVLPRHPRISKQQWMFFVCTKSPDSA